MTQLKWKRETRQRVLFGTVMAGVVAVLAFSSFRSRGIDEAQLDRVLEGLASGATTLPADGRIMLGRAERHLSEDGIAYATSQPMAFLLFPTWRGPGTKLAGYLWARDTVAAGDEVRLLVPRTPKSDEPEAGLTIAPTTMASVQVRKQRKPGWYDVERTLE